jgi:hypothetical protein
MLIFMDDSCSELFSDYRCQLCYFRGALATRLHPFLVHSQFSCTTHQFYHSSKRCHSARPMYHINGNIVTYVICFTFPAPTLHHHRVSSSLSPRSLVTSTTIFLFTKQTILYCTAPTPYFHCGDQFLYFHDAHPLLPLGPSLDFHRARVHPSLSLLPYVTFTAPTHYFHCATPDVLGASRFFRSQQVRRIIRRRNK